MSHTQPRMTHLFQQLGLDASSEGIEKFINENQLHKDNTLLEAPCWSEAQRQFLTEKIASDGEWAIVVDQLNEALHENLISKKG